MLPTSVVLQDPATLSHVSVWLPCHVRWTDWTDFSSLFSAQQDKRARKFIKRRLGTLRRAKGKMEALTNVIAEQRRAGH